MIDRPGGIFVRRAEQISDEDRVLLQSVARAVISRQPRARWPSRSSRRSVVERRGRARRSLACRAARRARRAARLPRAPAPRELVFFNGLGGFTPTAASTSSRTARGQVTPAPWVNVLANPQFGTVVSESGSAYTWSENAHEFRLTPWHNDPVSDAERRGVLPARRGERPVLVADAAALRAARDALRHPPRLRLQRLRAHRATASSPSCASTSRSMPGQVLGAEAAQPLGPAAPAVRHRLRRMGAGRPARRRPRCTWSPRSTRTAARCFARNAYNTEFADRIAFFDVDDADAHASPATAPSSSAATARCATRPRCAARGCPDQVGAGTRSRARAMQVAVRAAPTARSARSSSRSASAAASTRHASWCSASAAAGARASARRSAGALEAHARRGAGRDARPSLERAGQRLAGLPDARLPHVGAQRLLPVRRRVRLPRPAAGRDGARACRAAPAARAPAALRGAPVPRRRRAALVASAARAAACARTARTITSGCRWRLPLRAAPPATPACWTSRSTSSRAAR